MTQTTLNKPNESKNPKTLIDWPIKRALLSVSDKTGLEPLARTLSKYNVEIIASGGTAAALKSWGIAVTPIEDFTGNPEAFDGRMKTLSFKLESALLYDRQNTKHITEAENLGIPPIDLVVCNFYPFEKVASAGASTAELVHEIDVGGPTMVRAAAKNYSSVTVIVDPTDYSVLQEELNGRRGCTSGAFRTTLMLKAFRHVLDYDRAIFDEFARRLPEEQIGSTLRYGENPHQSAALFRTATEGAIDWTGPGDKLTAAVSLSYNNILDSEAAFGLARDLHRAFPKRTAAVIVKHQNPCGVAVAEDSIQALSAAWQGDRTSAFGGILALTQPFDMSCLAFLKDRFLEVILAPSFEEEALEQLRKSKKNVRLHRIRSFQLPRPRVITAVEGGLLEQDPDEAIDQELTVVTETDFEPKDLEIARFSSLCAKWIKSNAVTLARKSKSDQGSELLQLIGMGSGQPNRVDAIRRLAIPKADKALSELNESAKDVFSSCVLASDAFFPFADSIEELSAAGIKKVVQPGGSKRDQEVIDAANKHGIAMAFTGKRHFKH